jgi:hypothetical protein
MYLTYMNVTEHLSLRTLNSVEQQHKLVLLLIGLMNSDRGLQRVLLWFDDACASTHKHCFM